MAGPPARKVFKDNVWRLMRDVYGKENPYRLSRDAKVGAATMKRVEDCDEGTRLNTLERIATALRVPLWQLFHPGQHDGLTEEARELAELFDEIKDPFERARAAAMTRYVLAGQVPLAPEQAVPQPEPAPPAKPPALPAAAPTRKPARRRS